MKIVQYAKTWYERAMLEDNINSRIVFLGTGLATMFGIVALVIGFICRAKDVGEYPTMLMALGGGGAAAAAGRMMTKLGNKADSSAKESNNGIK